MMSGSPRGKHPGAAYRPMAYSINGFNYGQPAQQHSCSEIAETEADPASNRNMLHYV